MAPKTICHVGVTLSVCWSDWIIILAAILHPKITTRVDLKTTLFEPSPVSLFTLLSDL